MWLRCVRHEMIFHKRQLSLLTFTLVWYDINWVWNKLQFSEWIVNLWMIIIIFNDIKFVTVTMSTYSFQLQEKSCEVTFNSSSFSSISKFVLFSLKWDIKWLISCLFDDQCVNNTFEIKIFLTATLSFVLNRKCKTVIIKEIKWRCTVTLSITSILSVFVWRNAFTITLIFVTILVECFSLLSHNAIDMIFFDQNLLIVHKEVKMLKNFLFHFEVFT